MKSDHIPTYSPADIAERNKYIDARCAEIEPLARALFASAVKRESAKINADTIAEEARAALADLLANPEGQARFDEESADLARDLTEALKERPAPRSAKDEKAWLHHRGKDLARAVVGFWMNLGKDGVARYEASTEVLDNIAALKETRASRNFKTIYLRFWLDSAEASQLLNQLAVVNLAIPIAEKTGMSRIAGFFENYREFFLPQPDPQLAHLRERRQKLVESVKRMTSYSAECEPALGLIGKVDRLYASKLLAIRRGATAVRKQRIATLYRNKALTRAVVEKTFAIRAKPTATFNIRLKTLRNPAKSRLA